MLSPSWLCSFSTATLRTEGLFLAAVLEEAKQFTKAKRWSALRSLSVASSSSCRIRSSSV